MTFENRTLILCFQKKQQIFVFHSDDDNQQNNLNKNDKKL